ncbi:MAG: hypothetical protein WB811_03555 [Methanoregula sp.]
MPNVESSVFLGVYFAFENRYVPSGIIISNRAPFSDSPVSLMVIPVIARISLARNNPYPVFFPNPLVKI